MSLPLTAQQVLDREYFEIRARLLEVAAAFDRMERHDGDVGSDPRMKQFADTLGRLSEGGGNCATDVQLIFSLPYRESWRNEFQG